MSFRTPVNCSNDGIGNLERVFLDEMGAVFDAVTNQIAALETQAASAGVQDDLDEGNSLLQDLISTGNPGGNITYLEQIPDLFGIDQPDTQENDERKIVKKNPLLVPNLTDAEIPSRFNFNVEEISSSIVHKTTATTSAINNWISQGFDVELPAILDGEDP
jgi:hypothetical protein